MIKSIRNNIITGLVLVTPIVLTVMIVNWLFSRLASSTTFDKLADTIFSYMPQKVLNYSPEIVQRVVAFMAVLAALFIIGVFARNLVGKTLYSMGDRFVGRIPGISRIYLFIRGVSTSMLASRETMFQKVVLVQYPRKGLYALAFVTADASETITDFLPEEKKDIDLTYLFLPTTPNPTSGFLILVPREDVIELDINPGDAMKLIISAGVADPQLDDHNGNTPALLDKMENWLNRDEIKKAQEQTEDNKDV